MSVHGYEYDSGDPSDELVEDRETTEVSATNYYFIRDVYVGRL